MLTMVHGNGVRVEGGMLQADRKFLIGMQRYAESIDTPLMTINPEMPLGGTMDLVEVPYKNLGFEVMTIGEGADAHETYTRLSSQIARSNLLYGTTGLGCARIARKLGVPYMLVLETDLKTQIILSAMQVDSLARRGVRSLRCVKRYAFDGIPAMRGARALHCNGYPIYEESRFFNDSRLLYLDSRMSADMVIAKEKLETRLRNRIGKPFRLLFSGRYERIKGADDCVRVALECLRRGMNIEMHCYGQGSLRNAMLQLAQQSPAGSIHIHEAIPYPELVQRSHEFDLFVCCHIQSDPSCTYLETFGAGLPIVGYANRMLLGLGKASGCAHATPLGNTMAVADDIARLLNDAESLATMSRGAREFALAHTFEREFSLRTDSINQELRRVRLAQD
jgi:colanic acid/amylovoran biosynthesis glycosyltransferase